MSGAVTGPHSFRLRRDSPQVSGGSALGLATQLSSCFLWCHYSSCLSCDCCRSSCSHLSLASGQCWGLSTAPHLVLACGLLLSPSPSPLRSSLLCLLTPRVFPPHDFPVQHPLLPLIFSGFPNSKKKETWREGF